METTKVFVYGTLKVGGAFASRFDDFRISSKRAVAKGSMYDLGGCPAAHFWDEGEIVGEIHEYINPNKVLRHFDRIEGYQKGREYNLYNRIKINVEGQECWTYEFARQGKLGPTIKEW